MSWLLSTLYWGLVAATSVVLFAVALVIWAVTLPFDPNRRLLHQFTCFWASLYTWLSPVWRVHVEGREHVRRDATYVMVANHQSMVDILVLFRLFVHYKWVSKIENFAIPFIGWNMRLNRYIALRRGDPQSIGEMMSACSRALDEGNSIMMFPEGTRTLDGRLRPFKHGAFTLAQGSGCPLLPIVIEGSFHALPKKGVLLRGRHRIRVRILPEIPHEKIRDRAVEDVTREVRELFLRELGEAGG
jgi:1-acyl-sn-glycerol-3-phosphate acyltransferase